jgi:hypothetical protein
MIGIAPQTDASKPTARGLFVRGLEDLGPALGEKGLVRGNEVLARVDGGKGRGRGCGQTSRRLVSTTRSIEGSERIAPVSAVATSG